MSRISVVKKHHLSHAKAMSVAETMAKDLHKRFDLACTWDGDECRFERSGLTGAMHVGKDKITLDVKLGFLLSAVAPSIERAIHDELDKLVGPADGDARGGGPAKKPRKS
ncbi:MAG: polyhydroxyalkanoic acid system family protein [Burkholderiales bacterium]